MSMLPSTGVICAHMFLQPSDTIQKHHICITRGQHTWVPYSVLIPGQDVRQCPARVRQCPVTMRHFMVRALPCQLCSHSCTMEHPSSHTSLRQFTLTFNGRLHGPWKPTGYHTLVLRQRRVQAKTLPSDRVDEVADPGLHHHWSKSCTPCCVGPCPTRYDKV